MAALKQLLPWVDRLTGIDSERAVRGIETLSRWQLQPLTARLGRPRNLDDVVRAVLLVEDVEALVARGVPHNKLMAKLRDIGQFEATWAELRCAAILARTADSDVTLQMEAGKAAGAHADVRLLLPEGPPHTSIEIKSIGLSDSEVEFCRRMNPALDTIIPPLGIVTTHAPLDGKPPKWSSQDAEQARQRGLKVAAAYPQYFRGVSAAVIVARETERAYVRRAASRVEAAVRQLREDDECSVAVFWTNGAPVEEVVAAIDWSVIPANVKGLLFIGCVLAFPHRNIDCFQIGVDRSHAGSPEREVHSEYDQTLASLVLERTEASAGVRATLLRGEMAGKRRQLLRRDGSERIPPFNVLLDRDASGPMLAGRARS